MAYSKDLRDRVVAAVEKDGLSRRAAASRFGVGVSTAISSVPAYREEAGRLAPKRLGGRRRHSIRGGSPGLAVGADRAGRAHDPRAGRRTGRGARSDGRLQDHVEVSACRGSELQKTAVASERGRPDVARRRR